MPMDPSENFFRVITVTNPFFGRRLKGDLYPKKINLNLVRVAKLQQLDPFAGG